MCILFTLLFMSTSARKMSLVEAVFSTDATGETPSTAIDPRPVLPYRVQVADSDISIQFMQYYAKIQPDELYPCIIHALVEIYEAPIYDHGNAPLRGDVYTMDQYNVLNDVRKTRGASHGSLRYATVVRMLQAVQLFMRDFGTYGLSMLLYEQDSEVGHAIVRGVFEFEKTLEGVK